jgi:hypothetical protein
MIKELIGMFFILIVLLTVPAAADEYELGVYEMVEGQGVEVCEVCLKNLQLYEADEFMCERKYASELGLRGSEWTELDPLKNPALVKQLMLFIIPTPKEEIPGSIFDGDKFEKHIRWLMKEGLLNLSWANLDINNDGQPEPVAKFRHYSCTPYHPRSSFEQVLVVLDRDRRAIDPNKTDLVMRNPSKRLNRPSGTLSDQISEVFQYKGQLFFDKWLNQSSGIDTFSIYQAVKDRATRRCEYLYDRSKRRPTGGAQ